MQSFIALADVVVPENRIRRNFPETAIRELADSIESKGILHPPCLRNDGATLLAGERRLRAMKLLHSEGRSFDYAGDTVPSDMIPYTTARQLNELDLREAELEENVVRDDLTWQEKALAYDELRKLRKDQADAEGRDFYLGDVVEEVSGQRKNTKTYEDFRNSEVLAEHLDDPEVSSAPDEKTALKVIKRKKEAEHNAKLAEEFDLSKTPHSVHNIDALALLERLEDQVIDVVCTDPPYGMAADGFGDMAVERHVYEDSPDWFEEHIPLILSELHRICKENAHLYLFCDLRWFEKIGAWAQEAGWKPFRTPFIWSKGDGMLPWPKHGPRRTHEYIFFAMKGRREITAMYNDVIDVPKLGKPRWGAEKPAALYHNLLKRSVRPGDVVLDCFAGAGPIIPAANELSIRAVVTELSEEKYHHILTRLSEGIEE